MQAFTLLPNGDIGPRNDRRTGCTHTDTGRTRTKPQLRRKSDENPSRDGSRKKKDTGLGGMKNAGNENRHYTTVSKWR